MPRASVADMELWGLECVCPPGFQPYVIGLIFPHYAPPIWNRNIHPIPILLNIRHIYLVYQLCLESQKRLWTFEPGKDCSRLQRWLKLDCLTREKEPLKARDGMLGLESYVFGGQVAKGWNCDGYPSLSTTQLRLTQESALGVSGKVFPQRFN